MSPAKAGHYRQIGAISVVSAFRRTVQLVMRAVVQRVTSARVRVDGRVVGEIGRGLLVFAGVEKGDGAEDIAYVAGEGERPPHLRGCGRQDEPLDQRGGGRRAGRVAIHVVRRLPPRQKTVVRRCRVSGGGEGRCTKDSSTRCAPCNVKVETGEFQADMAVELINDGPVTMLLDSRRRW